MRTTTLSWLFVVEIIMTFRRRHYRDFSTTTLSWLFDVDIIMTFRRRHYHDFSTSTLSWLFDVDIIMTFCRWKRNKVSLQLVALNRPSEWSQKRPAEKSSVFLIKENVGDRQKEPSTVENYTIYSAKKLS